MHSMIANKSGAATVIKMPFWLFLLGPVKTRVRVEPLQRNGADTAETFGPRGTLFQPSGFS